jgi:hypothetical protein
MRSIDGRQCWVRASVLGQRQSWPRPWYPALDVSISPYAKRDSVFRRKGDEVLKKRGQGGQGPPARKAPICTSGAERMRTRERGRSEGAVSGGVSPILDRPGENPPPLQKLCRRRRSTLVLLLGPPRAGRRRQLASIHHIEVSTCSWWHSCCRRSLGQHKRFLLQGDYGLVRCDCGHSQRHGRSITASLPSESLPATRGEMIANAANCALDPH